MIALCILHECTVSHICGRKIHFNSHKIAVSQYNVFCVWYAEEPPPQLPPPRHRKVPASLSNAATPQDGDHDRTLVVKQVSFCCCYCCYFSYWFLFRQVIFYTAVAKSLSVTFYWLWVADNICICFCISV